jgi:capsular polysaccharide biosynthesis protein
VRVDICASGHGWRKPDLTIRNCHGEKLEYSSKRVSLRGVGFAMNEVGLQYFGYELSLIKRTMLGLRNQMALFLRNPIQCLSELISCQELSLYVNSAQDLPIEIESESSVLNVWVSRNAIVSGIKARCFGSEIEWDRMRNTNEFQVYIWGIRGCNSKPFNKTQKDPNPWYKIGIRTSLELANDVQDGDINIRNIQSCEVYNGLFAVKNNTVIHIDRSNCSDNISWPTNLLFSKKEKFEIIEVPNQEILMSKKAILCGSSSSWFHFLVEIFPRFLQIGISNLSEYDVIVRGNMPETISEILESLGVKSIVSMNDGQKLITEELITLTDLRFSNVTNMQDRYIDLHAAREYILSRYSQKSGPRFIFLERDDRLFRNLLNRESLRNLLEGFGFESVKPEQLSVSEQINLFADAEIVVSESGAALTNIMFMKPGSRVVEIHPGTDLAGLWGSLGHVFDVEVTVIYGRPNRIKKLLGTSDSFNVDLKQVKEYLQVALEV